MRTFWAAVSTVNGGRGGRDMYCLLGRWGRGVMSGTRWETRSAPPLSLDCEEAPFPRHAAETVHATIHEAQAGARHQVFDCGRRDHLAGTSGVHPACVLFHDV